MLTLISEHSRKRSITEERQLPLSTGVKKGVNY